MPYPFEVKRTNISFVLDLYRRRYAEELGLVSTDMQNMPDTNSAYKHFPSIAPDSRLSLERNAAKYFGWMLLESLLELSKSSTQQEVRDAFSRVLLFCRRREEGAALETSYSAVQSILVPGLFYVELGFCTQVDFHVEHGGSKSNSLTYLDHLKRFGFVPLFPSDLKYADEVRFCPGGVDNLKIEHSEYRFDLNSPKPSLLTDEILMQMCGILSKIESKFHLQTNGAYKRAGINNPIENPALRKLALFKSSLQACITSISSLNISPLSSDSDDDAPSVPRLISSYPFFSDSTMKRRVEDMGPYEKFKLGIE